MPRANLRPSGEGPGAITQDGCAVDLYARFPYRDELRPLEPHLPHQCSVLELGCGTGRLTRPLLARGHAVTAVDNSAEMLEHVPAAATRICSDIERLSLPRTFDVALYASNLINAADDAMRREQLAACRRHASAEGVLIFQRFDPEWLREVGPGPFPAAGDITMAIERVVRRGDTVEMSIHYVLGERSWKHHFTARLLDDERIGAALHEAGFGAVTWIDPRWGVVRPVR